MQIKFVSKLHIYIQQTQSNVSILCICLVYNRSCTILNICPVVALLLAPVWSPPTSCSMHSYLSAVWAERVITRSSFTDEFTVEQSRDDVQKINIVHIDTSEMM